MILLAWLFGVIALIVVIAIAVAFLNRFYRKTSRDVALVRTGFGGQKIVLAGGTLALPFLHKVDELNMRTMRVEVSRTGAKSLIGSTLNFSIEPIKCPRSPSPKPNAKPASYVSPSP